MTKKLSLFDHINQVTSVQNSSYWNMITEEDKKTWSNYMTHRFLSMKMEWIDIVNEFQKYNLRPQDLYKLYINTLPKNKQWLKYIKGEKKMKYPNWVYEIVAKYLQCSLKEASDAIETYEMSYGGQAELVDILMKYGKTEDECRAIGL